MHHHSVYVANMNKELNGKSVAMFIANISIVFNE